MTVKHLPTQQFSHYYWTVQEETKTAEGQRCQNLKENFLKWLWYSAQHCNNPNSNFVPQPNAWWYDTPKGVIMTIQENMSVTSYNTKQQLPNYYRRKNPSDNRPRQI